MSTSIRVGMFIMAALAIFGVAIFLIGDKDFLFTRTYRIYAPFDDVAGLPNGAEVRVGGVHVGTVDSIRLPARPEEKVTVVIELKHSTQGVVRKDSVASILTEGLMGSKFVSISFGSKDAPQVKPGDSIRGVEPIDMSDLMAKANDILSSTDVAMKNIDQSTENLKSITHKINSGQGTVGQLINTPKAYQQMNETLAQAQVGAAAFKDDMQALQKNFLLKGFFKNRGYYDSSELSKYEIAQLPDKPQQKKFTYQTAVLFQDPATARLEDQKRLDEVGKYLEQHPFDLVAVVAYTPAGGKQDANLQLAQGQAMVVRNYLAEHYKLDEARLKTKGIGEDNSGPTTGRVEVHVW